MLRKLEFDTIYYAYLNESPFKYYISILGVVGGLRPCLFCLFQGCVVISGVRGCKFKIKLTQSSGAGARTELGKIMIKSDPKLHKSL